MNSQSVYADNKAAFVSKNKELKQLKLANKDKEPTEEMVKLKQELKHLRKNTFKMDKKSIVIMNKFINHCIKTIIDSCRPCKTVNPEKTFGWKQLCEDELSSNRCVYSLL
jgi:hypothetical protein